MAVESDMEPEAAQRRKTIERQVETKLKGTKQQKKLGYTIINEIEDRAVLEARRLGYILTGDTRIYWRLSWYANKEGRDCWPSETTLADEVGVSVSTIFLALQRLKKAGLIEITTIFISKRWHNNYFLPFKGLGWKAYLAQEKAKTENGEHA